MYKRHRYFLHSSVPRFHSLSTRFVADDNRKHLLIDSTSDVINKMLKLLTLATLCLAVVTLVTADDYEVQKNPAGYGSK